MLFVICLWILKENIFILIHDLYSQVSWNFWYMNSPPHVMNVSFKNEGEISIVHILHLQGPKSFIKYFTKDRQHHRDVIESDLVCLKALLINRMRSTGSYVEQTRLLMKSCEIRRFFHFIIWLTLTPLINWCSFIIYFPLIHCCQCCLCCSNLRWFAQVSIVIIRNHSNVARATNALTWARSRKIQQQ